MADKAIQNWLNTNAPSKSSKVTRQLILPALEEGGKADTLKLTDPEYNRFKIGQYTKAMEKKEEAAKERAKEENKPEFSVRTNDDIEIKGKSVSDLKKEIDAYEGITGKKISYKKPEKVDEAKKRDEYIKQIISLQKEIDATEEVDTGKKDANDEPITEMRYKLPDNLSNMARGQQAALTDSVNFSYGREAIKSPENWNRFMQDNPEPDTGKTINQAAQDKYEEIYEEAKKSGVVLPNQLEEFAKERTQMWLETYLKDKYNVDYNAVTQ